MTILSTSRATKLKMTIIETMMLHLLEAFYYPLSLQKFAYGKKFISLKVDK